MSTRHVWRLARRPAGTIVADDFRFGAEPIPELSDGQYQDVAIYAAEIAEGERIAYQLADGRKAWVHVARGIVRLNGDELREGDSARIDGERAIELDTDHRAHVLLFDLE